MVYFPEQLKAAFVIRCDLIEIDCLGTTNVIFIQLIPH